MPALLVAALVALVILTLVGLGIGWFLRANPSGIARVTRVVLLALGGLGFGGLILLVVRFLPVYLPELLGFAGFLVALMIARSRRRASSGGFSSPGMGQRTEVRTAFLDAWIDHATGDVGGSVLGGRFAGRSFDGLSDAELIELHAECASDPDSRRVLEAYLDRRLGADWRNAHRPPAGPRGDMSRSEALAVLGLADGATPEEIKAAHRRLIQRVHPDAGGSADLAARINRAKDLLLGS
jgi:hypothetical protein